MNLYETIFIVRQDLQTQEVHQISDQYKEWVKDFGGELKKCEYWGLRTLAYEIKKNKKGHYLFYVVALGASDIQNLENKLKFREDIIRYVTFKVDKYDEKPSMMMQSFATK